MNSMNEIIRQGSLKQKDPTITNLIMLPSTFCCICAIPFCSAESRFHNVNDLGWWDYCCSVTCQSEWGACTMLDVNMCGYDAEKSGLCY